MTTYVIKPSVTQMNQQPIASNANTHLVLGGARSGKSRFGEQIAKDSGLEVIYVATAQAYDNEMVKRIEQHKLDRPDHWQSIEEPVNLPQIIEDNSHSKNIILVDCLTLWLMNLLDARLDIPREVDALLNALSKSSGAVVMVSNEITMGVVPMGEMSRQYVDELGRMHQRIAQQAHNVTLMVAGIPMAIKGSL
jgi:adenosylcobinamide kinase/adenosylcobinamide-phosphate guanylyltransferase